MAGLDKAAILVYSLPEAKVCASSFGFCVTASKNAGLTRSHRPKGHRLTVQEAGGKEMVPHQCPECKSVIAHKPGCSLIPKYKPPQKKIIVIDGVDKTKLRRVIEEDLRKEATVEEMVEYAQKRGIKIPRHPETPPDYHDEPGRPYFGPHQVRHASDLKVGEEYILVSGEHRQRIRLEDIMYGERHSTWLLAYTMGLGENETEFSSGWHVFSEHNLHPHSDGTWNGYMDKWLEFAPPATDCDCPDDNAPNSRRSESGDEKDAYDVARDAYANDIARDAW